MRVASNGKEAVRPLLKKYFELVAFLIFNSIYFFSFQMEDECLKASSVKYFKAKSEKLLNTQEKIMVPRWKRSRYRHLMKIYEKHQRSAHWPSDEKQVKTPFALVGKKNQ